jgi:subtilisin family serine protease
MSGRTGVPQPDPPTFGGQRRRLDFMPGQYFVRVHPEAVRPHLQVGAARVAGGGLVLTRDLAASVPDSVAEPLEYLRNNVGLKNVRPLFADAARAQVQRVGVSRPQRERLTVAASVASLEDEELAGFAICEIDPKAEAATLSRARKARAIDLIEPVPARWLTAGTGPDPMRNLQWGLRAIRWFEANRPDATSIAIGVLDTGIDTGHPDLAAVDIEYTHLGTRAEDIVGHGTHVAGIIAADTNNAAGIAGVSACSLHIWKVFDDTPYRGEFYVNPDVSSDALRDAARSGLTAVNLSLGGTYPSPPEAILIRRLIERGVAVVAAMGNEYEEDNPVVYPAGYDNVLAVGAVAETGERSWFSNTGDHIGICAPGSHVLSTLPRRRSKYRPERMYAAWDGTSMATPHVTAAAALVAAKRPRLKGKAIQDHLRRKAAKLPAMRGANWTREYGDGLLNLAAALS